MSQSSQVAGELKRSLFQKALLFFSSNRIIWLLLCVGIILRIERYLINRSLWLDEAALALNIVNKSFAELLNPLDNHQGAPIGFLLIERSLVQLLGDSEYVLRLFPLLAGILSLFLIHRVAQHFLDGKAVPVTVGLFAIAEPLVYYSSEVKQYSSDVTIVLLLYWIFMKFRSKEMTIRDTALLSVVGAVTVWFSHPSVFILSGLGGSMAFFSFVRKDWIKLSRLIVAYFLWLVSFASCYFISLNELRKSEHMLSFWGNNFMPIEPISFAKWVHTSFFSILADPVGLPLFGIAAFGFLVGCVAVFRKSKELFTMLISPVLITLAISALHLYPFGGRLLLFIVPIILLLIGEGAVQIIDKTRPDSAMIRIIFIGLLFYHPVTSATYYVFKPRMNEEIRPVIRYLKEHQKSGDVLYLYYGSNLAFQFYQKQFGYEDGDYIKGRASRGNLSNYRKELNDLRGNKRVWVLFSHVGNERGAYEQGFFLDHLGRIGVRREFFKREGAGVYLYDLSIAKNL